MGLTCNRCGAKVNSLAQHFRHKEVCSDMVYNGRKVHISQPFPRRQCSPDFERLQSPDLVRETNAWMAEFFGYTTLIPDGVVYELHRDALVMTQTTWEQLKKASRQ